MNTHEIRKEENEVKKLLCLAMCLMLVLPCLTALGEAVKKNEITVPELSTVRRPIPDNEAMTFLKKMGVGWNLGNTFDATKGTWNANADEMTVESSWCGVETTELVFDALKEAGFTCVRIPVSWHDHVSGPDYEISERWLNRVQEVVDWAYSRDMYVILNVHHDEDQFLPTSAHYEASAHYIECVWRQIAQRFRDYDERLILESMNEPRLMNSSYEWAFNPVALECKDAADCLNRLNQLFVDTVRATGGQNASRYLMVPAYDASPDNAVRDSFILPTDTADNKIIVSVHAYTPYSFALQKDGKKDFNYRAAADTRDIILFMNAVYDRYITQGIPVVIGEYGALMKKENASVNNLQARVDWTAFYVAAASARNLPCLWWDNHAFNGGGELFGLLNRRNGQIVFPEIVEAIMAYAGWDNLPDMQ